MTKKNRTCPIFLLTKDFAGFKIQPFVEIRASPEAGNRTEQGVNPYAWVSAVESVLSLFLPLTSVEARNPAVRVFPFYGPYWPRQQ